VWHDSAPPPTPQHRGRYDQQQQQEEEEEEEEDRWSSFERGAEGAPRRAAREPRDRPQQRARPAALRPRRAHAIARSLRTHRDRLVEYIATALHGELDAAAALDVARLVAHYDAQEEPQAWETVARHHVDRLALTIGMVLYRMHRAIEAAAERAATSPYVNS
jgi:hypothetical protein